MLSSSTLSSFPPAAGCLLNSHGHREEARAQVSLPRGGVTRVTGVVRCRQGQAQVDTRDDAVMIMTLLLESLILQAAETPGPLKPVGVGGILYLGGLGF